MGMLSNTTNCRMTNITCHKKNSVMMILAAAGLLIAVSGCGKSRFADHKPVVPVRGTLLFNGKPAVGAVIWFHPLSDPTPKAVSSRGSVGSDGVFELTTYAKADGVPAGEHVITVYWPAPSKKPRNEDEESDLPPDLLQGRFATRQVSILRAKIGDKPVDFAPVDLGSAEVTKSREYRLRGK